MSNLNQRFASVLFVAGALAMPMTALADADGAMVDGVVKEVRASEIGRASCRERV